MSTGPSTNPMITPRVLTRSAPRKRRRPARLLAMLALLALIPACLWAAGIRPDRLWGKPPARFSLVAVDHGPVQSYVVESGSLESADNATVRCEVEALVAMAGGGQPGAGGAAGGRGGATAGRTSTVAGANAAAPAPAPAAAAGAATAAGGAAAKAGGTAKAGAGGAGGGNVNAQATTASAGGIIQKPTIRSFSYVVQKHQPLRPSTATAAVKTVNNAQQQGQQQGGGGRGGNGMDQMQQQGSTTILEILEEGTPVEAGDVVCRLDSAAFEEELRAQQIRWEQAKSWVAQAEVAYKVAQIELREYRDGVYKQDLELIEQYRQTCVIQLQQAQRDYAWEQEMLARNLRTPAQVNSVRNKVERSKIALREAEGMHNQLVNFSGPKVLKEIEAKLASVEVDLNAQRESFSREDQRLKRLERAIANCTLRSPRKGIVVYANESNGWGSVEEQIREGLTVRQNMPIFQVPDPSNLQVRTKINESKVALLHEGTPALIRVDALPETPLRGRVTSVTVIPTPVNGPFSDVKVYYALVAVEQGFEGLQNGMSAKVEFLVDERPDVTRVPIHAVRWFDGVPFVATLPDPDRTPQWHPIEVGLLNAGFAEVKAGLEPGQRVVAEPGTLEPPTRAQREAAKAQSWDFAAAVPGR
jgi:multidrug resistance efflux pump